MGRPALRRVCQRVDAALQNPGLSDKLPSGSAVRIVCPTSEVCSSRNLDRFAERTGIPESRCTTRDEPNYDTLMRYRLDILAQKKLGLPDIRT